MLLKRRPDNESAGSSSMRSLDLYVAQPAVADLSLTPPYAPHPTLLPPLIDALPALEIVASFSVGIDRVDLAKCRERGMRVTNTPDVLTDDVADLAIAVLRRIPQADCYIHAGLWNSRGDYTTLPSSPCPRSVTSSMKTSQATLEMRKPESYAWKRNLGQKTNENEPGGRF